MSVRMSAKKALESLRNADDTQSVTSDQSDNDFVDDDDFDDETDDDDFEVDSSDDLCDEEDDDLNRRIEESIEAVIEKALEGHETDPNLDKTSKNGTIWTRLNNYEETKLRKKIKFNEKVGPTTYASRNSDGTKLSTFLLIFDMTMIRLIVNSTNTNSQSIEPNLKFTEEDIFAFIGILFCRGVVSPNCGVKAMWSKLYGTPLISQFMVRSKFLKIMKFLRFDDKTTRSNRVANDKFCMIRELWDRFIKNSQACYTPDKHLTVDEQLLATKNRCSFIQYIPLKPDKFGIKFWILVEVTSKYILNGFPYLGKDTDRPVSQLQGEYVVLKLIEPYVNKGHCVTADNFFTTLRLVEDLLKKKTTYIGTIRKNKPELPTFVNTNQKLYNTRFYENQNGCTLTVYQGKKDKNVSLLSSYHEQVSFDTESLKKKPNVVESYNKTKFGVDAIDNMTKIYNVKCRSRRWPVVVFFNILNLAAINSWILFKSINKSKITRQTFIRSLIDELLELVKSKGRSTSTTPTTPVTPSLLKKRTANSSVSTTPPSSKKTSLSERKKCQIRLCNENKSNYTCNSCQKPTCGVCLHEMVIKAMCKQCHNSKK